MENKIKNKKKLILSIIGIIALILFSVGLTYAIYRYTKVGSRNNIMNTLSISLNFEDNNWIWLENAYPISTEKALLVESNGSNDIYGVDAGLSQFIVFGNHNSGLINYVIMISRETITTTVNSKSGTYSLVGSNNNIELPDGAVRLNLQTSLNNIHETAGLVNDLSDLNYSANSFKESISKGYINTNGSILVSDLPSNGGNTNERVLGYGTVSGLQTSRYFELRMWIDEKVVISDQLRESCNSTTSNSDITTYGEGYCDPTTSGLPEGTKYVYSKGQFENLYYSNKIKIESLDSKNRLAGADTFIVAKLKEDNQVKTETTNLFTNTYVETGLYLREETKNDNYPIYYFRGNVQKNHLIFANKCWKIVRTTETGGTKIIYDGAPSSGECNNMGEATHIEKAILNSSINSPAYLGYKYGSVSPSNLSKTSTDLSPMGNIVYGKDVKYRNGRYTLTDTIIKNGANFSTDYNDTSTSGIRYHHYTCLNGSNSCTTVYYIYYLASNKMYYMALTGGKTHTQLLNEILSENDGTEESNVYRELNSWYTVILSSYAKYLEDTVFCNDRSIADYGGWDINNSNTGMNYLFFGAYGRLVSNNNPSLTCINPGDRYTVNESNGNGKLDYPVGLLTADEYVFAGARYSTANSLFYLYSGQSQWSLSPFRYGFNDANWFDLYLSGSLGGDTVDVTYGLRPVVSLSPSVTITSGDGSSDSPYLIELNQ